jgi:hypothetical protein
MDGCHTSRSVGRKIQTVQKMVMAAAQPSIAPSHLGCVLRAAKGNDLLVPPGRGQTMRLAAYFCVE